MNKELPPPGIAAVVCQLYQNVLFTFNNSQIDVRSGTRRKNASRFYEWTLQHCVAMIAFSSNFGISSLVQLPAASIIIYDYYASIRQFHFRISQHYIFFVILVIRLFRKFIF